MASVNNTLLMFGYTDSYFNTTTTDDYPQQFLAGAYNQFINSSPNVPWDAFISRFALIPWVGIEENLNVAAFFDKL